MDAIKWSSLPTQLKMSVLARLPYKDVRFFTSQTFWDEYWKHNFDCKRSNDSFQPNQEQEYVLGLVKAGKNVFVNSPAGTGKSALLKHVKNTFVDKVVGVTSTTGISALNINGSTLHSFLGIGLGLDDVDDLYDKVTRNPIKKKAWSSLDLLIIDEISMLHPTLFKKLEKLARRIRKNSSPFGGIQLLMAGDLFQLPCVDKSSTLIVRSSTFNRCVDDVVELTNIMRQNDLNFKKILNKIRVGTVDDEVESALSSRFLKAPKDSAIKPTMLFCTKDSVEKLNNDMLDGMAAKGAQFYEYEMSFQCLDALAFNYAKSTFCKSSTTPTVLHLTERAQVMLTWNLNPTLVNGSRGIVTGFDHCGYPIVEFMSGQSETVQPVKFTLHSIVQGKMRIVGYATQIPLKIAYALTVHSCQGSTLDCAALDLRRTFEYGQVYTALSRVKSLDGLYLKKFNFETIKAHPEALKFVKRHQSGQEL